MSNPSSDSYRNVTRYTGQDYSFAARYLRPRDPNSPTNKSTDIKPKEQQGHYPLATLWSNSSNGNLWALVSIVNNLSNWVLIGSNSGGPLLKIHTPDTNTVFPSTAGQVNFTGSSITITGIPSTNSVNYEVNPASVVQTISGDDTVKISPTGGNINLLTAVVANAANSAPIYNKMTAASTDTIQLQLTAATSSSATVNAGISSFNSSYFTVDSHGFVSPLPFSSPGSFNLGIGLAAGTFSVQSASGAALSGSNPAYISLQSLVTPGVVKTYAVTANQTFTSANLGNSLFGITTAVNLATDVPFYLYAVSNSAAMSPETTVAFMISRYPNTRISPVAGKIGKSGNTNASTQGSFFSLANITASDYASSPCLCVGAFRMQYTGGTTSWAVSTLSINDGIGNYLEGIQFSVPTAGGQFGAASGSLFYANGGTAPIFSDFSNGYYVSRDNKLYFSTGFQNTTNAGVGAVNLQLASPYIMDGAVNGNLVISFTNSTQIFAPTVQPAGPNNKIAYFQAAAAAPSFIQNGNIGADANFKFDSWVYGPIDFG